MSATSSFEIDEALLKKIKDFRFEKYESGNAAFVLKFHSKSHEIVEDEVYDNITLEELIEELPDNIPRYIILSFERKHDEDRTSFPLVFIYWSPSTAKPEANMLYTSAMAGLQQKIEIYKDVCICEPEELTEENLLSKI